MRKRAIIPVTLLLLISALIFTSPAWASCTAPGNAIEAENCLTGTPQSTWDISWEAWAGSGSPPPAGDSSIQGFADDISVDVGQTINFKIKTTASSYSIPIYRLGYYQGNGARLVTTLTPSAKLPQTQPACVTNASVGLYDCGNWGISASWTVPTTAVSGIYIARPTRSDTGGASHIIFIVRNDASTSNILFQASDTTYQAYNDSIDGQNLYTTDSCGWWEPQCRAYKVSYNRPFTTRVFEYADWTFNGEYPMIRWLEANGYDVSYTTNTDTDRNGALILNHKVWMSNGHDEYWTAAMRTNILTARNAGVNLAFFSGNTMFWKARWENSIDGSNTPYRTLACYKETYGDVTDPDDPPTWTGTWRDPTKSPPADGGQPENAVKGNIFRMNGGQDAAVIVPSTYAKFRFWRNTSVAKLTSGSTTLAPGTVGAEFDDDEDNGFRPAGLIRMSSTTVTDPGNVLLDYGVTYGSGTVTNEVVMYKAPSGALVFSTGSYQWAWGLDNHHDGTSLGDTTNTAMQQATVNLLADMGAQPVTLQSGLTLATASTDTTPPVSVITSPVAGATIASATKVTVQGTATDVGGVVAGVEVSTDNGATWHPATGLASWTYTWTASGNGTATIRSRATDDSGNMETPSAGVTVTVGAGTQTCPCTIFGSSTPGTADTGSDSPVELGVRFQSTVAGSVSSIRFYKSAANTGTHIGNLWSNTGTLLATATFANETASGWQTVNFTSPVAITANTYYMASYHSTIGHYAEDDNFFTAAYVNTPLVAPQDGVAGADGAYTYSSSSAFPASDWEGANYWVDLVFTPSSTTTGLSSVTVNPTSVTGGTSAAGTVTLTGPAPSAGFTVTLASNNAAATPSTTSVTIPSGSSSGTFTVNTTAVTTSTAAQITASNGTTDVEATLTITPVANLTAVSVNPTSVTGGNSSTGTVTLNNPAPTGGAVVSLSSNSASAVVPATATVAAGSTTATFTITTSGVSSVTTADISATYNSVTPTPAALTINPAALSAVSVNPTTVVGGTASTGTVTLTGPAPTGGILVSLQSNNAAVTVPGSLTVLANTSSITFQATTTAVTTSTPVTITATYAGVNQTATLTVTTAAQLAIDQTVSKDSNSGAKTIATTAFTTKAANELLLAFISADGPSSGTNTTVTGITGGSLTWTLVKRTNTQLGTAEVWRAFASAVLTNATVTATLSSSQAASMTVVTFTGASTAGSGGSGAIGATGTGNAATGAPSASLATTVANSWVFGVGDDWDNAIARTVPSNQTMVHQDVSTSNGDTYWVQRMAATTPVAGTVVTINDTAPTTDRYNLTIVEILP
ncbi:MAG: N,N-dimethylformamidase beta subunit family domain-containing protein [Terriglobales bacterium]